MTTASDITPYVGLLLLALGGHMLYLSGSVAVGRILNAGLMAPLRRVLVSGLFLVGAGALGASGWMLYVHDDWTDTNQESLWERYIVNYAKGAKSLPDADEPSFGERGAHSMGSQTIGTGMAAMALAGPGVGMTQNGSASELKSLSQGAGLSPEAGLADTELAKTALALAKTSGNHRLAAAAAGTLGDAALEAGRPSDAAAHYADAVDHARAYAESRPEAPGPQRGLARSLQALGDAKISHGDLAGAETAYLESHAIADAQAKAEPANPVRQLDLGRATWRLGALYTEKGELVRARTAYEATIAVISAIVAANPLNEPAQRDLTVTRIGHGDILAALGEPAAAAASFRMAHATAARHLDAETKTNSESSPGPDVYDWQGLLVRANDRLNLTAPVATGGGIKRAWEPPVPDWIRSTDPASPSEADSPSAAPARD